MYIKCWGSRGSIPVSGREFQKYGGDTTCIEIRTRSGDLIIVDAGTGIRRLGNQLVRENRHVYNFIFTHSHWDHLLGFPFFKPLYYEESRIMMQRCPFPGKYVESIVTKMMRPPHFPVRYSDLTATVTYIEGCPQPFEIGSVSITPISLSHPNGGCGYKFEEDGKSFVFLTDNELGFVHPGGCSYEDYERFCRGADLLLHDAEFLPEEYKSSIEWGHSSCMDTVRLAMEARVGLLGLFHMNQDRTDDEVDLMLEGCLRYVSDKGSRLECVAVARDMEFEL
ncbi:MAG: MBL fold metallo-hydrolase [Thermodesulfobacteriota bacterium]